MYEIGVSEDVKGYAERKQQNKYSLIVKFFEEAFQNIGLRVRYGILIVRPDAVVRLSRNSTYQACATFALKAHRASQSFLVVSGVKETATSKSIKRQLGNEVLRGVRECIEEATGTQLNLESELQKAREALGLDEKNLSKVEIVSAFGEMIDSLMKDVGNHDKESALTNFGKGDSDKKKFEESIKSKKEMLSTVNKAVEEYQDKII
jgi:hypothetical protein